MARRLGILLAIGAVGLAALPAFATTYYVSPTGNDNNAGTSSSAPLKSINTAIAKAGAGDTIYLIEGTLFTENVYFGPGSGGSSGSPKVLTTSSSNPATVKPTANDKNPCYIYNAGHITVSNVKFVGPGMDTHQKDGVMAYADNAAYTGLSFLNLDVSGFGATGVVIGGWNAATYGFRDVLIQDCKSHDNRKGGISCWGQSPTANQNITVRRCTVYNNLGDPAATSHTGSGIVLGNLTGGLIEYCIAYNNGGRCTTTGGPVGIWCWDATNVTIQFCEAYQNHAVNCDGGGFDLDGGCQGCVIQYCYSHDNDGPGYLICQYSGARAFTNNAVRYNVSENDGRRNVCGIQFWSAGSNGGIQSTHVYGNTVYNAYAPAAWYASGGISGCSMRNNILMTANGKALVSGSPPTSALVFQGNLYWASGSTVSIAGYSSLDAWRTATGQEKVGGNASGMLLNPLLTNPGAGVTIGDTSKLDTLAGYKLQGGSPCIETGLNLQSLFSINPGTRDYYGNSLPQGAALDIGAHECPPSLPAAPSALTAVAASSSQVNLSWTDNTSNETGFKLERKTGSGGTYSQIATVGTNVTTYSNTGLAASTTYYYRVRATNAAGDSAYSNEASATTPAVAQPGTLQFSSATYSKTEGNSGTSTVTVTVTRMGGSGGAVGVSYATSNGTATAGSDYTAASGTLSWTDAETASKSFTVTVTGDTAVEPDETVTITVSSPTGGATLGSPSTATLTIVNDDTLPAAPTTLTATAVHESRVDLAWTDNATNETGFEIEWAIGGGSFAALATVGAGVTIYTNDFLDDATLYTYRVRAVNASGSSAWSNSSGATTLDAGPLPNPWETADIGSCGVAGNASWRTDVFTGWGSGADIWNAADAFRFVYRPLTGDGEIRARVLGVENTNTWAKAGVMVRETLEAGSRHAMMVLTPGNGLSFQRRTATGGTSLSTSGGAAAAPRWVRVVRAGSTLTGSASTDGTTWTTVGTETIAMGEAVYVGLAVTSHDNAQRCTARFDNVSLVQAATAVDMPLAAGYTLIGLPLEPETTLDAEGLVQQINGQGGSCTGVIRYAAGQYETHPSGSSQAIFPIVPGEGYFVRCAAPSLWRMQGYRFNARQASVALSAGYTLVALPVETAAYTSKSATQAINAGGGSATQVLKYESGQFVTHPAGSSQEIFPLERGAGYFLRCTALSLWNITK
jgi:hypothetical protein